MSSKILRSVVAGLTACMFLMLFSACGTDKSASKESPSDWPASTWQFESISSDADQTTDGEGNQIIITINDRFTFSGGNSGLFNRTVSSGGEVGTYAYSKTGSNTGAMLLNFGNGATASINLIFDTPSSGTGSITIPPGTTDDGIPVGGRIYQISFTRI